MLNHKLLTDALRADLVMHDAIEPGVITGLLRWFLPEHSDYVKRVSAWQKLLCSGDSDGSDLPTQLLAQAKALTKWGPKWVLSSDVAAISDVHQIAMFYWKEPVDDIPTDWESYAGRIRSSGVPAIHPEIEAKLASWVKDLLGEAPSWDEMVGALGTGATSDRLDSLERWAFISTPLGVPTEFFRFNAHDNRAQSTIVVPVARAAAVPKNRKSTRIVASEPAACMFAQKAIMHALDSKLRKLGKKSPLWDADTHRRFLVAHHKDVVTVDLSDASDYISLGLAYKLLPPDWFALCSSARSQAVLLPSGEYVPSATFAPMGNGFCFRVLDIIVAAVCACYSRLWSVFGDDAIVDEPSYPIVKAVLQQCGLVINETKTCWGRFKESCGVELLDGYNITPFKPKRLLTFKEDLADIGAALRAADRNLPNLAHLVGGSVDFPRRYNRRLQRLEYRVPQWVPITLDAQGDGWPGMMRWQHLRDPQGERDVTTASISTKTRPGFTWLPADEVDLFIDRISRYGETSGGRENGRSEGRGSEDP